MSSKHKINQHNYSSILAYLKENMPNTNNLSKSSQEPISKDKYILNSQTTVLVQKKLFGNEIKSSDININPRVGIIDEVKNLYDSLQKNNSVNSVINEEINDYRKMDFKIVNFEIPSTRVTKVEINPNVSKYLTQSLIKKEMSIENPDCENTKLDLFKERKHSLPDNIQKKPEKNQKKSPKHKSASFSSNPTKFELPTQAHLLDIEIEDNGGGNNPEIKAKKKIGIKAKKIDLENKPYQYADLVYWTNTTFQWSLELMQVNKTYFNHPEFRPNQKAIINCTLSKRDVFVCMPTGGGKSLTFQLPALVDKGVTIVIMPLIALIYDQEIQMERKGIPVLNISGEKSNVNFKELLNLYKKILRNEISRDKMPKLIYSTPEKIGKSPALMRFLKDLYDMDILDRIVIDEAHCVSQWGRDFRPDYLTLGKLKEEFPRCGTMALTATATEIVKIDIVNSLKMNDCLYFQSSFNRINLIYEVRKKSKSSIEDMVDFIKKNYPNRTGIIYCNVVKEAEKISNILRVKYNLKCGFYHGKMKEDDRNNLQDKWMNDEIHIIVATLAFGMGINKPDVRFVIHYSFPKSISNYYQESGRAGRDGYRSHCIIYYQYHDISSHYFLLANNQISNNDTKKENAWELSNIVKYCEDKFNCRRVLQLNYLGEKFNKQNCNKTCDNCRNNKVPIVKSYTNEGKKIVEFLKNRGKSDLTLKQLIQLFSGKIKNKNKRALKSLQEIGMLSHLKADIIESILKELLWKKILYLKCKIRYQKPVLYIDVNKILARSLLAKQGVLNITVESTGLPASQAQPVLAESNPIESINGNNQPKQKVYPKKGKVNANQIQSQNNCKKNNINEVSNIDSIDFFESAQAQNHMSNNLSTYGTINSNNINKNKKLFHNDYGYCTEDQFEEILERLKIVRKRINTEIKESYKVKEQIYVENLENIFPLKGLHELCKKLPISKQELTVENIKNVSGILLKEHGERFLKEIQYFIDSYSINKSEFFVMENIKSENEANGAIFDITEHLQQISNEDNLNDVDFVLDNTNETDSRSEILTQATIQNTIETKDNLRNEKLCQDQKNPLSKIFKPKLAKSVQSEKRTSFTSNSFDLNDYVPDEDLEKVIAQIERQEALNNSGKCLREKEEDINLTNNNSDEIEMVFDENENVYEKDQKFSKKQEVIVIDDSSNDFDKVDQKKPIDVNISIKNSNNKRLLDEKAKDSILDEGIAIIHTKKYKIQIGKFF